MILDSSRRISCWNLVHDIMEKIDILNPNNDNDSSCTSFCSLACWSDVDINGTIVLVWSKQKYVYMTHITTKKEPKKEDTTTKTMIHLLNGMTDTVSALTISTNGRHVIAGSHEGEVIWWDLKHHQTNKEHLSFINTHTHTHTHTHTTLKPNTTRARPTYSCATSGSQSPRSHRRGIGSPLS